MPRQDQGFEAPGLSAGWVGVCGALVLLVAGGCAEAPHPAPHFPPLAPAPPLVGDITAAAPPGPITDIVRGRIGQIKHCYDRGLWRDPALSGKVVVRWQITADGLPFDVRFESSTLPDEEVNLCIARHIAFWEFPRARGGEPVEVIFPFVFQKKI